MAARHMRIGDVDVDLLLDGVLELPREHVTHGRGDAALASTLHRWGDRPLGVDVNCFLIRGPRGVEMVDAGTGPGEGPHLGRARAALAALGPKPEAVERVFLTHLHFDHALGLLEGDAPFFPNAEVIVPAAELAFFTDPAERARLPEPWHGIWDNTARIVSAYGGRLKPARFGPVAPGVEMLPLPGHTPGQGGFLFGADPPLLLFGDLLHFEEEQAADPDLGLIYDLDPAATVATRRAVLGRAAAEGWIVGGGHVRGFGRVVREGAEFRIVPTR